MRLCCQAHVSILTQQLSLHHIFTMGTVAPLRLGLVSQHPGKVLPLSLRPPMLHPLLWPWCWALEAAPFAQGLASPLRQ